MPLPRNDLQVTSVDEPIKIVDVRRLVIDVGLKDPPDSVTVEYFGPNLSVGIGFDPHLTMAMSLRDDARKVAPCANSAPESRTLSNRDGCRHVIRMTRRFAGRISGRSPFPFDPHTSALEQSALEQSVVRVRTFGRSPRHRIGGRCVASTSAVPGG